MARELNSTDEICRRLVFVVYIFCWTGMVVTGTIGLLQNRAGLVSAAVCLLAASLILKYYGEKFLDFQRLAKSFPTGNRIDEIPSELRKEVEELFKRFNSTSDWQERQGDPFTSGNSGKKRSPIAGSLPGQDKCHPCGSVS